MNGSDEDNLGWLITNIGDVESDGCEDLAVVANKLIEEDETTPSLTKNGLDDIEGQYHFYGCTFQHNSN